MKNMLFAILVMLTGTTLSATANSSNVQQPEQFPGGNPVTPLVINQLDSVYFDLSLAVINGSTVDFPVYFRSDDVINSLDFEFKYDHSHLDYDTILNLTSYIEPLAYYNPNDSVVRLTSYSFTQPYSNDTALVIVRFNVLSGQLCATDLYAVSALLNGDAASYKVTDCQTSGIFENETSYAITVFPNPCAEWVSIEVPEQVEIEIVAINSQKIVKSFVADATTPKLIYTDGIQNGIYILKVKGSNFESYKKLVISK